MRGKETILLVDDETDFLSVAKAILKAKGYEVDVAGSAREATARVNSSFYNVAVLDISLPDMDGTELLSIILGIDPDVIAIMLTGHSSVQNAVESLNRGSFAYLEKPLNPERLLTIIRKGLEKQALVFQNRRLIEEQEQKNRDMSVLLSFSQLVAQSLNPGQIVSSALAAITDTVCADAGYVYVNHNGKLVLKGCKGLKWQVTEKMKEVEIDGSPIGIVFKQAKPMVFHKSCFTTEPVLNTLSREGFVAHACMPLKAGEDKIGVLGVAAYPERVFSSRDFEQLSAMARETGFAMRNARLYEEAQSTIRELQQRHNRLVHGTLKELQTKLENIRKNFTERQSGIKDLSEFSRELDDEGNKLSVFISEIQKLSQLPSGVSEGSKVENSCELAAGTSVIIV